MKKVVKLKESELTNIIKLVIKEEEMKSDRYMFFSNLEQMRRQCDLLLDLNHEEIDSILDNGHDWAQDHIAEAKNNLDQVFDFLMNQTKQYHTMNDEIVTESKLDFVIGKPISLIKRLHTTKYNPDTGDLTKVKKDEEIDGEIVDIISDDSSAVPVMVVKYPNGRSHVMFEKSKNRFVEGHSIYSIEYLPVSDKDARLLNLFKVNYYNDETNDLMEGNSEITEKKKKNTPTNPKLWQQCLAWARSRYKVCPSAYCNGAAVKRYNSKGGKWKKK